MKRADLSRLVTASAESLPGDYVSLTARRLSIAAGITGAVYLVYLVLYLTLWAAVAHPVGQVAAVVGVVISLASVLYLSTGQRDRFCVTLVGAVYEVALALGLAISEAATLDYHGPSQQVSWCAVVIVLFPFLIPAGPSTVLVVSLAAAAMTPLAMGLVFAFTGRAWPDLSVSMSVILPPCISALLAWAPAQAIHRLGTAVQQARRLGSY